MDGDERARWKKGKRRWTGPLHRQPSKPISVAGILAAVGITATAITMFVSTLLASHGTSGAGQQPVVLPGICSNCAGTPTPVAPTPGRSTERASRSTGRTPRPTRSPTRPPPAVIPEAPTTSPSMTEHPCPPPLPTKTKTKRPKVKDSTSPN